MARLPQVTIVEVDGRIGSMATAAGDIACIVGPADSGPFNTPMSLARQRDVVEVFKSGPLVEFASYLIENSGKRVVCVRSKTTHPGNPGVLESKSENGDPVDFDPAFTPGSSANDQYDLLVEFVRKGEVGVDGITYCWSLDGGRTMSPETALGDSDMIEIPDSGGIVITLDITKNVLAGDTITSRTVAPREHATDLDDAFTSIRLSDLLWDTIFLCNTVTESEFEQLDKFMTRLLRRRRYRKFMVNARDQKLSEKELAWEESLISKFKSSESVRGALCAGYCTFASPISGRRYRRPASWAVALKSVQLENPRKTDMAEITPGRLRGVSIDGEHNEDKWADVDDAQGLDDARFLTLRTVEGFEGTYVTRPRIFKPAGSDYAWWQYRALANQISHVINVDMTRRLRAPTKVDPKTGFIFEGDALNIETGVTAAVERLVGPSQDVSSHRFVLSRTDKILSDPIIHGQARFVPLAYPDEFVIDLMFENPAVAQG